VSANYYLFMWTISSSQLLEDMCLSKSLLVQIEKEKKLTHTTQAQQHTRTQSHTRAPYTGTHALHTPMHSHTLHTCTHAMHMHTLHTRHAHTPCTGTHFTHAHAHAQHYTPCTTRTAQRKKFEGKRGQSIQTFFEVGVANSAKHISSVPKGKSSSTVELQIGGAAAPELVWWSRSPPKHALTSFVWLNFLVSSYVMPLDSHGKKPN
jgi:hypothetical protein